MGFDDLEDAVEEQDRKENNASDEDHPEFSTTQDKTTTGKSSPEESESTSSQTSPATTNTQPTSDTIMTPAFEFDDTIQKAFYAREESWREFNAAADFDIKRALHEQGVDDISRSEITEAVLWAAIEDPEKVAEQLLAMRRGDKL